MSASNGEDATARAGADDLCTMFGLQRRDHDLCRARGVFAREYNEWKFYLRRCGTAPQSFGKCFQFKRGAGTIGETAEVCSFVEKQRCDIRHRFGITAAVRAQIQNDTVSTFERSRQRLRELRCDALRECIDSKNRDVSFALVAESQLSLVPVTPQDRRLLFSFTIGPRDFHRSFRRPFEECADGAIASVGFVGQAGVSQSLFDGFSYRL